MVLWDYRLPHATSDRMEGDDAREVVYMGFLPSTEINEVRVGIGVRGHKTPKPSYQYREYAQYMGMCCSGTTYEEDIQIQRTVLSYVLTNIYSANTCLFFLFSICTIPHSPHTALYLPTKRGHRAEHVPPTRPSGQGQCRQRLGSGRADC